MAEPEQKVLPITLGVELLVEITNLKLRIKSLMVGMEHGRYIIVKISPQDLIGNFRSEAVLESPMIIRYLYNGTVYGFKSKVLNVVSQPAKLFFVTYPEKIEEFSVRNRSRYECVLPASTMFGNNIVDMIIVDISREGCQAMIKVPGPQRDALYDLIQVNKRIEMKVQFPGSDGKYDLVGIIRNVGKETEKIILGVLFEELPQAAKERLGKFIELITETGKKSAN
ncbi:MAG: PilZ domain-containing protein [Deltaproteobacteria bacterium]|nr:PilZ domain-containing protein [Deltaproteobacteria bacterium]